MLSGAQRADTGEILINGEPVSISNPRDAKALGIETIYQTLALADNLDAPANLFLGRELTSRLGNLDDDRMEDATRKVMGRLNPNFQRFNMPVKSLSGGQRQAVAIARAVHFNAKILIMDEPTAALGPAETAQVRNLVRQLKNEGIGIFLISHDIHDVYDLADRVSVMYHGQIVDTVNKHEVSTDDILGMIILGKKPGDVTEKERPVSSGYGGSTAAGRPRVSPPGTSARGPDRGRGSPRAARGRSRHRARATRRPSSRPTRPWRPRDRGIPARPDRGEDTPRRRPPPRSSSTVAISALEDVGEDLAPERARRPAARRPDLGRRAASRPRSSGRARRGARTPRPRGPPG